MDTNVLDKYDVKFYREKNGESFIDCKNRVSSYLYIWKHIDDINDFLDDINLCLGGKYNEVRDPHYGNSLLNMYGELKPNELIISEESGMYPIVIPLIDFKIMLISWKEFSTQSS